METLLEQEKIQMFDSEGNRGRFETVAFQEITAAESRRMRYAYRDGALARNSAALGKKDSTSVFLTRDMLEKMIELIDQTTEGSEFSNLGLRAHWANFPADHTDPLLAGRQTFVVESEHAWLEVI